MDFIDLRYLSKNGIRELWTGNRIRTIVEYERNFRNVLVTHKTFGLQDVRIQGRCFYSRTCIELKRMEASNEISVQACAARETGRRRGI